MFISPFPQKRHLEWHMYVCLTRWSLCDKKLPFINITDNWELRTTQDHAIHNIIKCFSRNRCTANEHGFTNCWRIFHYYSSFSFTKELLLLTCEFYIRWCYCHGWELLLNNITKKNVPIGSLFVLFPFKARWLVKEWELKYWSTRNARNTWNRRGK